MIRALVVGTLISLAYASSVLTEPNTALSVTTNNQDSCKKSNHLRDTQPSSHQHRKIIDIPVIKDCDSDETQQERQQQSVIDSQNCDCSQTHRKRCPGHISGKKTNVVGTWSPLDDTAIKINFDGQGNLTLQGCNINSCGYTLTGRKFSRDGFCLGTKRFCPNDKDSFYLDLLNAAKFVVSGGKDKLVFLDQHFHKILQLYRVQV